MSKRKKQSDMPSTKFNVKKTANLRSFIGRKLRQRRKGNCNYLRSELKDNDF